MGVRENVIEAYGKGDGLDNDRFDQALRFSAELDYPVTRCFRALISLEDKQLIILEGTNDGSQGNDKKTGSENS